MKLTISSCLSDLDKDLISLIKSNMPTKDLMSCKEALSAYDGEDWKDWVKFSEDDTYKRNLVYKDDNFDMYIICWKGNQTSKFHDHAENGCLFRVLQGEVLEIRKVLDSKDTTDIVYTVGDINYINNTQGVHKIINITDKPAITLHIYSPANYKCKLYND